MGRNRLSFEPRVMRSCEESWAAMEGNSHERHCELCAKQVHNFAAMTSREIETLVQAKNGELCARITRRGDGSLVTLDALPRASMAAQIAASAALVMGAAGAVGQAPSDGSARADATIHGVVLRPNGADPAVGASILIRHGESRNSLATTNARGEFQSSVLPGTYDILIRDNAGRSVRIAAANLHPGWQSLRAVLLEPTVEFVTVGDIVAIERYSFIRAVRHPLNYLRYLTRKL